MAHRKNNQGIALMSVLMLLLILTGLCLGFAVFTINDYTMTQANTTATVTFYLAQSGLEYAQYLLKHNMLIFPTTLFSDPSLPGQGYNYVGEAVNLFAGEEHMVINSLTWGTSTDSTVNQILGTRDCCGTFWVQVFERPDTSRTSDPNCRVLYIKSIGKIKKAPPGSGNPSTWDYTNDEKFKTVAQRTLIMRIPYRQNSTLRFQDAGGNQIHYKILNDGWYEKFR